LSGSRGSA